MDLLFMRKLSLLSMMVAIASHTAYAEDSTLALTDSNTTQLQTIKVVSADASATGLMPKFAGGLVASGGRLGIFGNQKNLNTPFNLTSYTNEYIQKQQARSVGDVLRADPSVRVGRGFGNFQENYYIRGFNLGSDDTAYNGLYSILPRQYIPTELFERVEVLKGASAFLNGSMPSSGGIGGAINLLPKRAGIEPLNRVTVGTDFNGGYIANDVSRRFGENQQFGVRINTAYNGGNTPVDQEKSKLGLAAIGLDYQGDQFRVSGDMGYSNNRLNATRPNVTLGAGVQSIPTAVDASSNYAQKWTYSNEEHVFGSYRAEYDFNDMTTAYAAYGFRHGTERNALGNYTLLNDNGSSNFYRFENARVDLVNTGEIGIRSHFSTGKVNHQLVLSASAFQLNSRNAYVMDFFNTRNSNIYTATQYSIPTLSNSPFQGGDLNTPKLTNRTQLRSLALGDNLSMLDDRLIVMLGLRYQEVKQDSYSYTQVKTSAYDESKVTPALGLTYKFTPQFSAYANYMESLAKGLSNSTGDTLKPFVAKQKEIGVKYENDLIGASMSVYHIDKQRAVTENGVFTDSGKYVHQGIELNTYGKITDTIKVLGGVSWISAKQKNTGSMLYDGKKEVGVPEFQANLGADWQLPIPQDISLNAQVVYTGTTHATLDNRLKVKPWTTLDLGAIYKTQIANVPTTLNFRVNNVLGKDYWSSVGLFDNINSASNSNYGYLVAGQPRTFMLSASFDF